MKIFFSEFNVDYTTYTFPYAIYCLKESQAELPQIYDKGFLPYTGNLGIEGEVFYLARSLRVNLQKFDDTSENRRVNRLIEPLNIQLEVIEKANFDLKNPIFLSFCENYINERIGEENMSMERLEYILSREIATHLFQFSSEGKVLGYVLAAMVGDMLHYWFSFFDVNYLKTHSLGKWMMWRTIRWGKDNGLKNVYLGTAYKPAALYKIRDHKGLEFFDGNKWNEDAKRLKSLCETDLEPKSKDHFKALDEPNGFLNDL
jgi:leucyl-tRNA---protein transferase